jgi:hypothetical protein
MDDFDEPSSAAEQAAVDPKYNYRPDDFMWQPNEHQLPRESLVLR